MEEITRLSNIQVVRDKKEGAGERANGTPKAPFMQRNNARAKKANESKKNRKSDAQETAATQQQRQALPSIKKPAKPAKKEKPVTYGLDLSSDDPKWQNDSASKQTFRPMP